MNLKLLILTILTFSQHPVLADIVTDGSVGPAAQSINAIDGQFTIDQKLGSLKGNNLFHSFEQFDIERNETATFTGDESIKNVISRVTGRNESHINGILRSEVGSADFYFINPAGVVFEENAQVDVPASFHVSTADKLIFDDESSFSALNPEASTLTVAKPKAFGFTSDQSGSLKIIGGQLKFKPGTNVSLSTNGLDIKRNASITVERTADFRFDEQPGLHLNLAAIDSSKAQEIPIADLTNTSATGGELSIKNSKIDVSGNGSGRLTVRAGTMTVTGSKSDFFLSGLFANNWGAQDALGENGIFIDVDSLDLEDATISSQPINDGDGGKVEIKAKQLKISGSSGDINTGTQTNGNAGKITVTASGAIEILNNGNISSGTLGPGTGGIIVVTAGQLTINGQDSQISSDADSEGNAGHVKVKATGLMKIQNGGKISSDTSGSGSGGVRMRVEAGRLIIVGTNKENNTVESITGISNRTSKNSKSDAGPIIIEVANTIQLQNHGQINTSSVGGAGGDIRIASGKWNQLKNNGQILANVEVNAPNAGDIKIPNAGDIRISSPVLILDNGKIINDVKIISDTKLNNQGGDIKIAGQTLGAFDLVEKPSSRNVISATSGVVSVEPAPNLAADLVSVIAPNLNVKGINQDPCAHRDENSLKSLGHGGAPAFQHGENYLLINRFDESDHEPEDMGTRQIMPSINTDYENTATDCDKPQHTSLN